jgi:hypothetical protein
MNIKKWLLCTFLVLFPLTSCESLDSKSDSDISSNSFSTQDIQSDVEEPICSGLWFVSNGDGICTVCGEYEGEPVDVVIPETSSSGDKVTSLTRFNGTVRSVTLPNSVTEIKASCFEGIETLESITFSDNLYCIGDCAFRDCVRLSSVKIPASVMEIGDYVFRGCDNLFSVYFDSDSELKALGYGMFYDCVNLAVVKDFPTQLEKLSAYAFYNCRCLEKFIFQDGVKEVGDYCFYGCVSLAEAKFLDNLETVGDCAFMYCESLSKIIFGDTTKSLGENVCFNTNLQAMFLPASLETIKGHLVEQGKRVFTFYCEPQEEPGNWNLRSHAYSYSIYWGATLDIVDWTLK